ncbi:MAG: FtsX-like permease family protein [Phycisphaerae bacterium]
MGCSPRAAEKAPTEEEAQGPQKGPDKKRLQEAGAAVELMLPRIREHVRNIASFGPRQTGQAGCDRTLGYIKDNLVRFAGSRLVVGPAARQPAEADAATSRPGREPGGFRMEEFSTTVTAPLDRLAADDAGGADGPLSEHSNIAIRDATGREVRFAAYSLMPNCVQSCRTHPPEQCPLRSSAPGDADKGPTCPNCEQYRPLVDLGAGGWDDLKGKDLRGAVVLLDFNSADAWLKAAELGAYGAVFVEPKTTTVFQADLKYIATLPLHFPRLYVNARNGAELRDMLARKRGQEGGRGGREDRRTSGADGSVLQPSDLPGLRSSSPPVLPSSNSAASGAAGMSVKLASRLEWRNVTARGIELNFPGKSAGTAGSYCFVLAGHFDARSVVPDLAYGGDETWGIAELLETTRWLAGLYSSDARPECDTRVMFVSGHWQNQKLMRDYFSRDGRHYEELGRYIRMGLALDMSPQTQSVGCGVGLNLMSESQWDYNARGPYLWLSRAVFTQGGWRDQLFDAFGYTQPKDAKPWPITPPMELLAGVRPIMATTLEDVMADRNNRSPLMYAPRYSTAEEIFQYLHQTSFAFQTGRLTRLLHFTPLDRIGGASGPAVMSDTEIDRQLRPQLQVTLGALEFLQDYPAKFLPRNIPTDRGPRGWGGYGRLTGRVLQWDRSIGWFAERLPGQAQALAGSSRPATGADLTSKSGVDGGGNPQSAIRNPQPMQTFVHAYPTDSSIGAQSGGRPRNYIRWPQIPSRGKHRELQCFTFQDLMLVDRPDFRINAIYTALPGTQYNTVAYSLDAAGRIRYATDYGVHGDGNKAFQCCDLPLDNWDTYVPVSLFECGTIELMDLTDPQRYDPRKETYGDWLFGYGTGNGYADMGVAPYLRVAAVKDTQSHTDLERWGFTQYGPTAMVFLPASGGGGNPEPGTRNPEHGTRNTESGTRNAETGPTRPSSQPESQVPNSGFPVPSSAVGTPAEILLGSFFTNFAVLNNPDSRGEGRGYSVASGQTIRLSCPSGQDADDRWKTTPAICVEQLSRLDGERIRKFKEYDVSSPLANRYHAEAAAAVKEADAARGQGDQELCRAEDIRSWVLETQAYRNTMSLLVDVVSTTVLYFVLLIPFSFLMERLVLPQRTVARTAIVATSIFAIFAGLLYAFHPGFKLAHNVLVITITFIIVVMSLPALILLLVRGVAMLRAIGSKAVITQQSEAESAGMVMASLSLAVSNMRRRKLRTALTLATITMLVVALVLLTTSSAFDFKVLEPGGGARASFQGVQVYNSADRRYTLVNEMVDMYEALLKKDNLVIRREFVNYGYDPQTDSGCLYVSAAHAAATSGGASQARRSPAPYLQLMDEHDDEIEYTLPGGFRDYERRAGQEATSQPSSPAAGTLTAAATKPGVAVARKTTTKPVKPPKRPDKWPAGGDVKVHLRDLMVEGEFFAEGDEDVCLLPNNIAEDLKVHPGDTVTLIGLPLKVKGIWEAQIRKLDAAGKEEGIFPGPLDRLRDLDGLPITALRQANYRGGEADNPTHAPSSEVVIVPRRWIARNHIFPTNVHSMIVIPRPADKAAFAASVSAVAERLASEILNVDVFSHTIDPRTGASSSERISMRTATHIKGSSMMLVVMVVAVLMILAIMTGTVYERMREIHIFSSVGLSPRHVAGMFFIEALVYAGIAAVLGYFIGIIALKVLLAHLKSTGQQQDFYPNYLGVFVLYSIGVAVLATLASSLYPIRLASKIVNPSAGRTWEVSETAGAGQEDEDHWHIRLPFIATTWNEVLAMMVYAYEYLVMHQGERSGRFVCERPPRGSRTTVQGLGEVVRLTMPVWLAPFERNLSQTAVLQAQPSADAAWWELHLDLRRLSGPPYLWKRGTTIFVNMVSKHLLRWRAATPEQEAQCLSQADRVFPVVECEDASA